MQHNVPPEGLTLLKDKISNNDNKNGGEEQDKQTSGTTGKKIALGVLAIPMILLNISLNAVQSIGRQAVEFLRYSVVNSVMAVVKYVIVGFLLPTALVEPKGWIGKVLCLLAGLFPGIIYGVLSAVSVLFGIALYILIRTPILLIISACSWIYNGFVGCKRLFKNIGKNEIFISNRYQNLGASPKVQEEQTFIKKWVNIFAGAPTEDEKAQPVSFTQAAVRYTLGVADVKSEDELIKIQKVQGTEYTVKPKSFPYRTGGYMIY